MPRIVRNQLSAAAVRAAGPGRYTDGNGLMLYVKQSGARSWVQRLRLFGERVDLGLGSADRDSADYVSLAQARRTALENRRMVRDGVDPRRTRTPSFAEAQRAAYAELLPQWKESSRFAEKWVSTMERYVLPRIGAVPVDRIEARHVKRALAPIAAAGKADTVRRTGGRIRATLEWARIEGHYDAPDPVDAVVRALRVAKVERTRMAALPHRDVSGALEAVETAKRTVPVTRHAFRFMVLTAARGMEVRRMEWRDVDLDAATWNRPADKMKAGKAHRVPLSRQALDVLEAARGFGGAAGLVFPAQGRRGQMLPDNAIRRLVSRVCDGATAHGFRSSFRDWAGETGVEREVAELCLAHVVGDSNERAYARSDLLERRRPVMQRWGDYVAS
ncbi:MAG: DUF4102 domain-containing protein [Gammaproteobacteria bacterium]|nr:DUF4102 domain-containing protein [Gammaproteobacteria bacterium]